MPSHVSEHSANYLETENTDMHAEQDVSCVTSTFILNEMIAERKRHLSFKNSKENRLHYVIAKLALVLK